MRIGMVTACYKPVINGVTKMISLYKAHLESAGHEVTVFTLGNPDPAGEEPGVVRSPAFPLGDSGYYYSPRYTWEAQKKLREMDIIHCHHLFMSVGMAHRYGFCPIVYTNHTRYDLYTGTYMPLPQPTADAIMRQVWPEFTDYCDVVVTPSESVRQVMVDFGVRRPIRVIANGVDLEPFYHPTHPYEKSDLGIPPEATAAMYVGRLSAEKNLETLLSQFVTAQEISPALHLIIVGKGPMAETLPKYARQLGVADKVHFVGAVTYEDVANYLAAADFFVTASVTEVHPLTLIEAMAAGLPVVAYASPGIVDTVETAVTGLLTRREDGGLAAGMVALAENPARRRQMALAARECSKEFDIRSTIGQTIDLYEELRRTRPDLVRQEEHGRWHRTWPRLQPLVEQLINLTHPPKQEEESLRDR
ncbi:MAG: glycosyltransferase [Candidatus Promineifilaceae bacterium]